MKRTLVLMTVIVAGGALATTVPSLWESATDVISREFTVSTYGESLVTPEITVQVTGPESTVSREFTVGTPYSELRVTAIIAPEYGLAERPFTVEYTVTNLGSVPTESGFTDYVWLSSSTDPGGTLVASIQWDTPLNGGESYTWTSTELGDDPVFGSYPGTYYVVVQTDRLNEVVEWNEQNNITASDPIQVDDILRPDLYVTSIDPPPSGIESGEEAIIQFTVTNQGPGATTVPSWTDRVYLSTDSILGGDVLLAERTSPVFLEPGDSYSRAETVNLPTDIEGEHYILVHTDARDVLIETDNDNNVSASLPFNITLEPQPDLQVTQLTPDPIGYSGTTFQISWTDRNAGLGTTDTGTWTDRIYVSDNDSATIEPGDLFLGIAPRNGAPLGPSKDAPMSLSVLLPPDLSGTFWIKVETDTPSPGQISEVGFEHNNISVSDDSVLIELSPTPDLQATSINGPTDALVGYPIDVDWRVMNIGARGGEYTFSWQDGLYLSLNQTLEVGSDVRLGSFGQSVVLVDGVWVPQDYTKQRSLTIPHSVAPGSYYLILSTDDGDSVFEVSDNEGEGEDNNILVSVATITVADSQTDLQITAGFDDELPSDSGAVGATIHLPWRVTNEGTTATNSSNWYDRVYLSTDTVFGGGDTLLASRSHNGVLQPGESYVSSTTATVPQRAPASYFLLFVADAGDQVLENGAEDNNVASHPFEITPEVADIALSDFVAPSSATSGSTYDVTWTVTNVGDESTLVSSWTDALYLSSNASWDSSDTLLGAKTHVGILDPQEGYDASLSVEIPLEVSGSYYAILVTDRDNRVYDGDDTNEEDQVPVTITLGPIANLVASSVTAEATVISGQDLDLGWDVENTGGGSTGASWVDRVYLSTNQTFDPGIDIAIGYEVQATLDSGESRRTEKSFSIPFGYNGEYFVIVDVDSADVIFENGLESDNTATTTNRTVITHPPDADEGPNLEVTSITLDQGSASLGDTYDLEWVTTNQDQGLANGSWRESVYLSLDSSLDSGDRLVAQVEVDGGTLAQGESVTTNTTVVIPGLEPGDYRVLIKTDATGIIPESNELDNVTASETTIALDAIDLVLGETYAGQLNEGQEAYFRFHPPAGDTVQVDFQHQAIDPWNALYVRESYVPDSGRYDFASTEPGSTDQSVVIPTASGTPYYIFVRAITGSGPFTLSSSTVPIGIESVLPETVGAGVVTIEILGSRLHEVTRVEVESEVSGRIVEALEHQVLDGTHLLAAFDLKDQPHGLQTIRVLGGTTAELPSALTVSAPTSPVAGLQVEVSPSIRKGAKGQAALSVSNAGNINVPYTVMVLAARPDGDVVVGAPYLGQPDLESDGAVDSLMVVIEDLGPSQSATIPLEFAVGGSYAPDLLGFGYSGRALTEEALIDDLVREIAETMRLEVLADPDAPADLLERASDESAWHDAARTGFAVSDGDLWIPGTWPSLGSEIVDEIASAAIDGLPLGNSVDPAILGRVRGDLYRATFVAHPEVVEALLPVREEPMPLGELVLITEGVIPVVGESSLATPTSQDPNEKVKPKGFGAEAFVGVQSKMDYRIHFENVASAEGPAARVIIVDELDPVFRPATYELGTIGIGDLIIEPPENSLSWRTRVDLTETHGVFVDIVAGIGGLSGRATWSFQAIDPDTGVPPSEGGLGFLPPEDGSGSGQGFVDLRIGFDNGVGTGTVVRNQAVILFDKNPPIGTPPVDNQVDADVPNSQLTATVSDRLSGEIQLRWSGVDPSGGAGLASHSVYVSEDDRPFLPLVVGTTESEFLFQGTPGSVYTFYSIAVDHAGNVEAPPSEPDARVKLPELLQGSRSRSQK